MKKIMLIAAAAALVLSLTGCCSLRTPAGKNHGDVYYYTFFGISIESAVYGDGLIVNGK